jgi:hypothetical protein
MVNEASPFLFGRNVSGNAFTSRETESTHLISNFRNGVNTILISPRRWGKTSLVRRAGATVQNETLIFIYIDAFSLRDISDFYALFATEVIKATSATTESWIKNAKKYFANIAPFYSFGSDPFLSFQLSFERETFEKNYLEILDLPERIAVDKNIRIIICIDEFQNTTTFKDASLLHKRLKSAWQNHKSVSYCLSGCNLQLMSALFEKPSRPFYKFGEHIFLKKIAPENWSAYIIRQFDRSGKLINGEMARKIAETVQCHPYYVQQLSHLIWSRTPTYADTNIYKAALNDLITQNGLLYQRETELLSETQLNFLKALASGVDSGFSNKEIIQKYKLGTSANVTKQKKVLVLREIIDVKGKSAHFVDPAFQLWFEREIIKK